MAGRSLEQALDIPRPVKNALDAHGVFQHPIEDQIVPVRDCPGGAARCRPERAPPWARRRWFRNGFGFPDERDCALRIVLGDVIADPFQVPLGGGERRRPSLPSLASAMRRYLSSRRPSTSVAASRDCRRRLRGSTRAVRPRSRQAASLGLREDAARRAPPRWHCCSGRLSPGVDKTLEMPSQGVAPGHGGLLRCHPFTIRARITVINCYPPEASHDPAAQVRRLGHGRHSTPDRARRIGASPDRDRSPPNHPARVDGAAATNHNRTGCADGGAKRWGGAAMGPLTGTRVVEFAGIGPGPCAPCFSPTSAPTSSAWTASATPPRHQPDGQVQPAPPRAPLGRYRHEDASGRRSGAAPGRARRRPGSRASGRASWSASASAPTSAWSATRNWSSGA